MYSLYLAILDFNEQCHKLEDIVGTSTNIEWNSGQKVESPAVGTVRTHGNSIKPLMHSRVFKWV